MSIELNSKLFRDRLNNLINYWSADSEYFNNADCILVAVGLSEEDEGGAGSYQKGVALQSWLLTYEFPDTIFLITKNKQFVVLASAKKAQMIEACQLKDYQIITFKRSKVEDENVVAMNGFFDYLKKFENIGVFPKDKYGGKWWTQWQKEYQTKKTWNDVDVSAGVAIVLGTKDDEELKIMKNAGKMCSLVMKNYFSDEMAKIIDAEKIISHEKLSEKMENSLFDPKIQRRLQLPADVNLDMVDWCYTPVIQSGGKYDLKPSAVSDDQNLHSGVVLCSLGVRYKNYCTNIGRTFLIDPTKEQERQYNFLVELQKYVFEILKDGAIISDVFTKTLTYVHEKYESLESHFVKNLGFVTGLEYRESTLVLNSKNSRELFTGMTVNLILGFSDLVNNEASDKKLKNYALMLADTVLVGVNGSAPLTDAAKSFGDVSFFFKGESDEENKADDAILPSPARRTASSAVLKTKLRAENKNELDQSADQKRKAHQAQLLEERIAEGLERFADKDGADPSTLIKKPKFRKFESYKKESSLFEHSSPLFLKDLMNGRIVVDTRNDSVVLPLYGYPVPFHISTLKNITKNEEGEYTYLRFNFNTPGISIGGDGPKTEFLPYEDDGKSTFVKSLTLRSMEVGRYGEVYRQITEMKRDVTKKEAKRREMADLVEQDRLTEAKRPFGILQDVTIRPPLEGKKLPGDLQIHLNGLRYQPVRGDQRIDVLFSNIKHLFFQPCDNELYVIIHCHLKDPIMVGKKKTKDVQFIREASDASIDETSNRRRRANYGDEDELMAEQDERRHRQRLNKEFKAFADKINETNAELEADVPIRELGFNGVPARSNVFLQPTTECLVHLSEMPFVVLTISEIELAYLERVQFHLKNFDIVFVFKDLTKTPFHINSVPMNQVENIKEWLDSVDILTAEGPHSLSWNQVMKEINANPYGFYEDGAWGNFMSDSEKEGEEVSDDEDSASEFEISESDSESSDESDYSEEEDDSEGSEEELSDEGEDWDELEKKAKNADARKLEKHDSHKSSKQKQRRSSSGDEDLRPKKKKHH